MLTPSPLPIPLSWNMVLAISTVLLVLVLVQRFGRLTMVKTDTTTSGVATLAMQRPIPTAEPEGASAAPTRHAPAPRDRDEQCDKGGLTPRQRRRAESRRVLAGSDLPSSRTQPMRLFDALYEALGEVEGHERVEVGHFDPASIHGVDAPALVHLMAELIENALAYSPPQRPVEVSGCRTPVGYTILVTDHGGGMIDNDIARANHRLAGEDSQRVVPTCYLGHYVTGHLARRIGVVVALSKAPDGGITAGIDVPATLLEVEQIASAMILESPPAPAAVGDGRAGHTALFPVGPSMYAIVAAGRPRRHIVPVRDLAAR